MAFAPEATHYVGMHSSGRQRPSSRLGWSAVVLLCGAALLLLQAGHPGFGWACLLVALAVVGYVLGD